MPAPQKFGAELKIDPVPQQFGKDVPIDAIPNDAPAPTPRVTQFERQRNAPPQTVGTFLRSAVEPIAGTVSGLYRGVTQGPQNPEEAKAKNNTGKIGLLMKRMVVDPAKEQMAKAQTAKTPSESIGHSIAAAIPIVGPWAAQYAEEVGNKAGKGDIAGALGTTAGSSAVQARRDCPVSTCDCHACELGDRGLCYGCPTHGAWCDWHGEGPRCSGGDQ